MMAQPIKELEPMSDESKQLFRKRTGKESLGMHYFVAKQEILISMVAHIEMIASETVSADALMKSSQGVLNLAHSLQILEASQNDVDKMFPETALPS
tara:strand:- start:536 stop:826 length:291 start_codon:yes stop_codon:yes gene_type:complete